MKRLNSLSNTRPSLVSSLRLALPALFLSVLGMGALRAACVTDTPAPGCVHFLMRTDSSFSKYLEPTTSAQETWLQNHFWGLQTFSPSQDQILPWYHDAVAYVELYGIPPGSTLALAHPEWILKDANGNNLYLNYNCKNGACSQWAFDFSNPGFVQYQIQRIVGIINNGYKGVWLDNIDMQIETSDGNANPILPIDPNTGALMTQDAWKQNMANIVTQIRQAVPHAFIIHNALWFAGNQPAGSDPAVQKQIAAADMINLERGISSSNLVAGGGFWSMNSFLSYIDVVHSLGKTVDIQELTLNVDYALAGYYLISTGLDALSNGAITPNNWWSGYDFNIGTPYGDRYTWNGLLRRDFSNGLAFLNPPGAATVTFTLPSGNFNTTSGVPVTSVTLAAGKGAVLIGAYTPPVAPQPVRINSGGPAVGSFMVDSDVTGGHSNIITSSVIVAGVANAAPQQIYQTKLSTNMDGVMTYTIPALTPNYNYTVRLHFADDVCTRVNQRLFNVLINGTTVLPNFDIYKAAGLVKLKAVVESFTINSGASGKIVVQIHDGSASNALINGVEILP